MKEKIGIGLVLLAVLGIIVELCLPIFARTGSDGSHLPGVFFIKQVGNILLMEANDNGGKYPSSLKGILKEPQDEKLRTFIEDPHLEYFPPKLPAAQIPPEYSLLVFHYSEEIEFIYHVGGNVEILKNGSK